MNEEWATLIKLAATGKTRIENSPDENGCFECMSETCCFNHDGVCRFAAVHNEQPIVTEEDGCLSGVPAPITL